MSQSKIVYYALFFGSAAVTAFAAHHLIELVLSSYVVTVEHMSPPLINSWLRANASMTECARPGCRRNEAPALLSCQFVEQGLGLLQIERIEPFGEPAVDRREKIAGLIPFALVAPEPRHAHRGT